MTYRFELPLPSAKGTQQFMVKQSVNRSLYHQIQVDAKVRVRFLSRNPNGIAVLEVEVLRIIATAQPDFFTTFTKVFNLHPSEFLKIGSVT